VSGGSTLEEEAQVEKEEEVAGINEVAEDVDSSEEDSQLMDAEGQTCKRWCATGKKASQVPWVRKCLFFKKCKGCEQCKSLPTLPPACQWWCAAGKKASKIDWDKKCKWKKCTGCTQCQNKPPVSGGSTLEEKAQVAGVGAEVAGIVGEKEAEVASTNEVAEDFDDSEEDEDDDEIEEPAEDLDTEAEAQK